jgi:hypothetical protein
MAKQYVPVQVSKGGVDMARHFVIVTSLVLALRCTGPQALSQEQLVGNWRGAAYQTQFGTATNSICFQSDGIVESVIQSQAGPIVASGTYAVSGDTLTLRITDAVDNPKRVRIGLLGGELTITDGQNQTTYKRVGAACDRRH